MNHAMSIWSVMMNDGKSKAKLNGDILVNKEESSKEFKPVKEIAKFFTCQSDHTFPIVVMGTLERLPTKNPEKLLKMRSELQEEIKSFLGKINIKNIFYL